MATSTTECGPDDPALTKIKSTRVQVAESFFTADGLFVASLERLVSAPMARLGDGPWRGRFPPYVDGLLFDVARSPLDRFEGHGIGFIDIGRRQYVDPVRVALRFDPAARSLDAATLLFRAKRSTQARQSVRAAERLRRDVLAGALGARQKRPFAWRHRFTLKRDAWSHKAL